MTVERPDGQRLTSASTVPSPRLRLLIMMSKNTQSIEYFVMPYLRPSAAVLTRRLAEPRRFLQVVAGPRQVGKTTLVQQVIERTSFSTVTARSLRPKLKADGRTIHCLDSPCSRRRSGRRGNCWLAAAALPWRRSSPSRSKIGSKRERGRILTHGKLHILGP